LFHGDKTIKLPGKHPEKNNVCQPQVIEAVGIGSEKMQQKEVVNIQICPLLLTRKRQQRFTRSFTLDMNDINL